MNVKIAQFNIERSFYGGSLAEILDIATYDIVINPWRIILSRIVVANFVSFEFFVFIAFPNKQTNYNSNNMVFWSYVPSTLLAVFIVYFRINNESLGVLYKFDNITSTSAEALTVFTD